MMKFYSEIPEYLWNIRILYVLVIFVGNSIFQSLLQAQFFPFEASRGHVALRTGITKVQCSPGPHSRQYQKPSSLTIAQ